MNRKTLVIILVAITTVAFLLGALWTVSPKSVRGNEMMVVESWGGVEPNPYGPGTHFLFPGFMYDGYNYDMGTQVYVMNNAPDNVEAIAEGRAIGAYTVQSKEGQDMTFSVSLRWRRDPSKLIDQHTGYRDSIEERLIRPELMRVVKNSATQREAIAAYSGDGLVALQQEIENQLSDANGILSQEGVIVETFVIENIELDPTYINEIKQRQVSFERDRRIKQEEVTAHSEAKKAEAEARAEYNRRVVKAEADKAVAILEAEQRNESAILAAQAEKQRKELEAEGERNASLFRAEGIKAEKIAEAEGIERLMAAYSGAGSENYVTMEVSKSFAQAFSGVQGFIPENMNVTVMSEGFMNAVKGVVVSAPHQTVERN